MTEIIVLFGMQGAGKSQAAESLRINRGFNRVSLADPIYEMIATMLGKPVAEVRTLPKNNPMPELGGTTLRVALQTLGTEWGRNTIHKRIWVDAAVRRLTELRNAGLSAVIDDCRFLNEFNALRSLGAKFVKLERLSSPPQIQHESEREWWKFKEHVIVQNNADSAEAWLATASDRIMAALALA